VVRDVQVPCLLWLS